MNRLRLEESRVILEELAYRQRYQFETFEYMPELDNDKMKAGKVISRLREYQTHELIKEIKFRRPVYFMGYLYLLYTVISLIIWAATIIYMKCSGMDMNIHVGYSSMAGWNLSHPIWISIIIVNAFLLVLIYFGYNICRLIRKFLCISFKTLDKYKEEKG